MPKKTKRELETENEELRSQVARLEGEIAGLRAVADVFRQLAAPGTAPTVNPPATIPVCVHDFPSHMVGPVSCRKCGMIARPLEIICGSTCGDAKTPGHLPGCGCVECGATLSVITEARPDWLALLGRPLTDEERLRFTAAAPLIPPGLVVHGPTLFAGNHPDMNSIDHSLRFTARVSS